MKSQDAMIVWTPNREPFDKYPSAGTIAVTTIPEPAHLEVHPASYGASNLDWKEMTLEQRQSKLQSLFVELIHRDLIPESAVRAALSEISDLDVAGLRA